MVSRWLMESNQCVQHFAIIHLRRKRESNPQSLSTQLFSRQFPRPFGLPPKSNSKQTHQPLCISNSLISWGELESNQRYIKFTVCVNFVICWNNPHQDIWTNISISPYVKELFVGIAGFEPAISCVQGKRGWPDSSISRYCKVDRIRTCDPMLPKHVRYQLRYYLIFGRSGGIRTPNARRRLIYSQLSSQLLNTPKCV